MLIFLDVKCGILDLPLKLLDDATCPSLSVMWENFIDVMSVYFAIIK